MADSASTTLRILADASQVTSTFKKVDGEWKAVADKASKSTQGMMTMLGGIPAKLMSISAAIAAVGEAARAVDEVGQKKADLARQNQTAQMNASVAAARAGGSPSANMAFINSNQSLFTTQDQRVSFMSGLGSIQEEWRKVGRPTLSKKEIEQVQRLYNNTGDVVSGTGGSDILDAISKGGPNAWQVFLGRQYAARAGVPYAGQSVDSLAALNMSRMPADTRTAYKAQWTLERSHRRQLAAGDLGEMSVQSEIDASNAENPWMAWAFDKVSWAAPEGIPGRRMRAAVNAQSPMDQMAKDMAAIRASNDAMAKQAGPVLPNRNVRNEYVTAP